MNRERTVSLQRRTGSAVEPCELTEVGPLLGLFDDGLNVGVEDSDQYHRDRLLKASAPYSVIILLYYSVYPPSNVCYELYSFQ